MKTTNLGVFAIAGVSSSVNLVRNMIYTVPFTAKYLGLKWNTFFPEVFSSVVSIVVLVVIGIIIKRVVIVDSWIMLVISAGLTGGVGLIINVFIVLNKNEREYVLGLLKKKLNIA